MKTAPLALAFALAASGPALSETIGTVTASFDGKEPRTFYAFEDGGESQSFWVQPLPGMLNASSFSIWANPEEGANSASDVVVIGGTLMRGPGGYMVVAGFEYLENGYSLYWTNPEEDAVAVDLTKVEEDGERLVVEGTFTAPVFRTENAANPQTDMGSAMTVTGSFSASLPKD